MPLNALFTNLSLIPLALQSAISWQPCEESDEEFIGGDVAKSIRLLLEDDFTTEFEKRLFAPQASVLDTVKEPAAQEEAQEPADAQSGDTTADGKRKRKRGKGRDDPTKRLPEFNLKPMPPGQPSPKQSNPNAATAKKPQGMKSHLQKKSMEKRDRKRSLDRSGDGADSPAKRRKLNHKS